MNGYSPSLTQRLQTQRPVSFVSLKASAPPGLPILERSKSHDCSCRVTREISSQPDLQSLASSSPHFHQLPLNVCDRLIAEVTSYFLPYVTPFAVTLVYHCLLRDREHSLASLIRAVPMDCSGYYNMMCQKSAPRLPEAM